eukprot:Awhi_evm1s1595
MLKFVPVGEVIFITLLISNLSFTSCSTSIRSSGSCERNNARADLAANEQIESFCKGYSQFSKYECEFLTGKFGNQLLQTEDQNVKKPLENALG